MFEPHEDRRLAQTGNRVRLAPIVGFIVGFAGGWLVWFALVLPRLRSTPTAENPSGDPADWLYYGSLIVCVVLALLVVSMIGEFIGARRQKAAAGDN